MQTLQVSPQGLEFVEHHSPLARGFLFLVGLFPLIAPWELLIKPRWQPVGIELLWNFGFLFFLAISLGAMTVSFGFLGAAIFGRNQQLSIDAASGHIDYRSRTAFGRERQRSYRLADISGLTVHTHEWDSRSDSYALQLTLADGVQLRMGDSEDRQKMEGYLQVVEGWRRRRG